ncbi:MAG: hypothetical protein K9M96_07475 [Deltaproteobacteria bacterium]|nr:hypothetical protein [Deltaproteobacteria bacterium]
MSWAVFYFSLKGVPDHSPDHIQLLFEFPSRWVYVFLLGIKASILDLDYINAFPLLAWGALIGLVLSRKNRRQIFEPLRSPVALVILINLGIQIVMNSGLVGFETSHQYSLLRYMPQLIGFSLIPLFLVLERVVSHGVKRPTAQICLGSFVLAAVAFSNIFTFSYWFSPAAGRQREISWWPPVYAEILERRPDPFKTLIKTISQEKGLNDQTIVAWPPYVNEILNFYVGDRYLIIPNVLQNSACEESIIQEIGLMNYRRFKQRPKWIVFFLNPLRDTPPGYELKKIPFFRPSPDATRPELTRHHFVTEDSDPFGYIYVYRKL